MAKYLFSKDLEGLAEKLAKLADGGYSEKCVYAAAGVVADEIKSKLNSIHAISDEEGLARYKRKEQTELTYSEKKGLLNSLGIAPFSQNGSVTDTHVGFDGYNGVKTRKYPNGQPNVLIARSTESGTNFRKKQPFVRPAVNQARQKAIDAAQEVLDKAVKNLIG